MRRLAEQRSWLWIIVALMAITVAGEVTVSLVSPGTMVMAQDPAEEGAETKAPTIAQKSYLAFLYESLGLRYVIVFLSLSFTLVAFIVMNSLAARRDSVCPAHLIASFDSNLNEKKFQEAYELAKNDDTMLGQILASGMAKLSQGYDVAMDAMNVTSEDENMKIDRRLSYVQLIGTLSPMFGLLGTVDGMVASFMQIAASDTPPKPSKLAEGISMALVTTLIGLWLAIPAIAAYALLKVRMAKLSFDTANAVESLMGRFQTMGKK